MSCLRHSAPARLRRGVILSRPLDSDRVVERELIQCCHCQYTTPWSPGLEKGWGLCGRCNDWHCPAPLCRSGCRPHRQWLHRLSDGLAASATPVLVSVPVEPPRG